MRHAIVVVGSDAQREQPLPTLQFGDDERLRCTTWYAGSDQEGGSRLLDDQGSLVTRLLLAPLLAYRFYILVQNTKLWSKSRPFILIRGRSFSSRLAAYAGSWGGGDVVQADAPDVVPLRPVRFLLDEDGSLKMRAD